jgi:hypothetical protein
MLLDSGSEAIENGKPYSRWRAIPKETAAID